VGKTISNYLVFIRAANLTPHAAGCGCGLFVSTHAPRDLRGEAEWNLDNNIHIHWHSIARRWFEFPRCQILNYSLFQGGSQVPQQRYTLNFAVPFDQC
jgi:hypothetical protein